MNPRKKSKPNPKADVVPDADANTSTHSSSTLGGSQALPNTSAAQSSLQNSNASSASVTDTNAGEYTVNRKASRTWLAGGSWRSKATATVKTAKDSIGVSVSGGAASQIPDQDDNDAKSQSPAKFLTKRKSSKGEALPASMTKLNVSSDGALDQTQERRPDEPPQSGESIPTVDEPPLPPEPTKKADTPDAGTWGWRSWWSRPDGYAEPSKGENDAQTTPLPGVTPSEEADAASKELGNVTSSVPRENQDLDMKDAAAEQSPDHDTEMQDAPNQKDEASKNTAPSSWFWLWSSTQNVQPTPEQEPTPAPDTTGDESVSNTDQPVQTEAEIQSPKTQQTISQPPQESTEDSVAISQTNKSSGWAFWFKDRPKVCSSRM